MRMPHKQHDPADLEAIFSSDIVHEDKPILRILAELSLCETNGDVVTILERLCARLEEIEQGSKAPPSISTRVIRRPRRNRLTLPL